MKRASPDLTWQVHAWIMPLLDGADRARVEAAMAAAIDELAAGASVSLRSALTSELGLPLPGDALRLIAGLRAHLWEEALVA